MLESAPSGRGQYQTASNWYLGLSDWHFTQPCGMHGTGFSYRRAIDFNAGSVSYISAISALVAARSQSESGLDLAGRRRKAERPARIRGKSARSEAERAKRRRRGRLL